VFKEPSDFYGESLAKATGHHLLAALTAYSVCLQLHLLSAGCNLSPQTQDMICCSEKAAST
jgi:hypothetical protein